MGYIISCDCDFNWLIYVVQVCESYAYAYFTKGSFLYLFHNLIIVYNTKCPKVMNNGLIIYILMRERERERERGMQMRCIMVANSANFHNIN